MAKREKDRVMLKGEAVAVWWTDAEGLGEPMDIEEARKHDGLPMLTVGVLVSDDGKAVRLCQDYYRYSSGQERVRDTEVIPKAFISKMRKWKI